MVHPPDPVDNAALLLAIAAVVASLAKVLSNVVRAVPVSYVIVVVVLAYTLTEKSFVSELAQAPI